MCTTESQPHIELASIMCIHSAPSMKVQKQHLRKRCCGYKWMPHVFRAITPLGNRRVESQRNPDSFIILRGVSKGPKYDEASLKSTPNQLIATGGRHYPGIVVDCPHGSSKKDFRPQKECGVAALRRGVGITDGCLGWASTVASLGTLANAVLFVENEDLLLKEEIESARNNPSQYVIVFGN
ncbi:hypothetical protein N7454_005309 [Penicillium verhagenii]|nr:hypothetical protein N7454_005309 [Penicillium verhagenii]